MDSPIFNPFKNSALIKNNISIIKQSKNCTYDNLSDEDDIQFYYPNKKIDRYLLEDNYFNNNFVINKIIRNKKNKGVYVVEEKITNKLYICKVKHISIFKDIELNVTKKLLNLRSDKISNCITLKKNKNIVYLIIEYIDGITLGSYFDNDNIPQETTHKIFYQCLECVKYIHSVNLIHCDIKPENFIIDINNKIVLIDFDLTIDSEGVFDYIFGTENFISPESYDFGLFCKKSDVWALGVVFFYLLTKQKITHSNMFIKNSGSNLYRYNFFKHLNIELIKNSVYKDIIVKMTDFYLNKRPNIDVCLKEFENINFLPKVIESSI